MAEELYLYILSGLPFAGKTTLAKILERTYSISRVALDDINTERGIWNDKTGLSSEEWTSTYNEAYRRIDLLLSQGRDVVDDSTNFTRVLRDRLRSIALQNGARPIVIFVDIPVAEARRRWQENQRTMRRADVRESDFMQVVEQFEPPVDDENMVRYDGSLPVEAWLDLTIGRHIQ